MSFTSLQPLLHRLFQLGVCLTLCLSPTQWSVQPKQNLHLSPADLMLAGTATIWLMERLLARKVCWRLLPHWTHLLFMSLLGLSVFVANDRAIAIKDTLQVIAYFIIGSAVFDDYLRQGKEDALRTALTVLGCVTLVVLILALSQYRSHACEPLAVRGTFGNRNVLGGYLALALPLVFAGVLHVKNRLLQLLLALLLIVGISTNLAGAAHLAIVGTILCMAATRGPVTFIPILALLITWQAIVLPRLPRENDILHYQTLALYDESAQITRRYPEWQAAASLILTHPWLGVGPGNYQKNIGQYYDNVPRQTGPAEPDIQNLYLVLAASAGLPALAAFLAMMVSAIVPSTPRTKKCDGARPAVAWGAAAALCAFSLTAIWHPLLVRGIGLPLAFTLALARYRPSGDPL